MQRVLSCLLLSGGTERSKELTTTPLITLVEIAEAAGVIEVPHIRSHTDHPTDRLDGCHQTTVGEMDATGLRGTEERE